VGSISADVNQSSCITIFLVDTNNLTTVPSSDTLNIDIALALAGAVTARAIHFAVVFGVEVDNL
jgi:hypothetical protein